MAASRRGALAAIALAPMAAMPVMAAQAQATLLPLARAVHRADGQMDQLCWSIAGDLDQDPRVSLAQAAIDNAVRALTAAQAQNVLDVVIKVYVAGRGEAGDRSELDTELLMSADADLQRLAPEVYECAVMGLHPELAMAS